ncbi:tyrosine-protein kinase RYK isoform X1 [Electrophorus electricus]|uniref:tyrosine-protein kinase RYK isoform X1 n=2 Tax=Electrophorus electricus TaxID=8005 RepID=UPI0015CF9FCD|nr:tyrosine-protein kinase RYK isoform X1 [Electrophorus electricus]
MLGSGGCPSASRAWPWRLGGFFWLLLLDGALCLAYSSGVGDNTRPSVNVYMSEDEVKKLLGLDAELYYIRDDVVNRHALSFIMPVPSETNSLHFAWQSKSRVEYRLGFQVENPTTMDQPQSNISAQGEVPRTRSVFRVDLFCSGKVDGEAILTVQLNLTIHANNFTVLNFKRRKMCYRRTEQLDPHKIPPFPNRTRPDLDSVNAPATSTRVFYISVGVCCAVIFLVAIILAVLHLHSMKTVEADDSASESGSSQGLSQPSTQTTQYLRADTPNNATPITNVHAGSATMLQLSGAPTHESKSYPSLRIEKNDLRSVTLLEAKAKVKDIAISRERVTLSDVLHEGTFGRIFHGVLLDDKDPNKEKQVFVKTVKEHASEVQVTMMLTESCKLRGLHHRNLLPISHVCTEDGEKPMVLLPYMNWGNLKLFLRQCKLAEANNPQAISQQDLVHMAIQIACGMSYLARREVIHKDLAARNCVIDDGMQVKITDNALARDLFPMDYHCLGDNENRPVRWMALESLLNNDFSSASDVWAFGVTLWELMTLGQTPYVDIDPFEMAAYLKDGYRIAQPINCPDELFAVMACCWALDPEERPKFQQLVQCLTEFHAALGAYV